MTMPPGEPHTHATERRHLGRELFGVAIVVAGVALMLYGAFAMAFALGCFVLGALFIGCGALLAYESTTDQHDLPPAP